MKKYLYLMTGSSFIGIFFVLIMYQYIVAEIILYFCISNDTTRRGTLFACQAQ